MRLAQDETHIPQLTLCLQWINQLGAVVSRSLGSPALSHLAEPFLTLHSNGLPSTGRVSPGEPPSSIPEGSAGKASTLVHTDAFPPTHPTIQNHEMVGFRGGNVQVNMVLPVRALRQIQQWVPKKCVCFPPFSELDWGSRLPEAINLGAIVCFLDLTMGKLREEDDKQR